MDGARGRGIAGAALSALARGALARGALALVTLAACNPFVARYRPDPAVQMHTDGARMTAQWNGVLAPPAGRDGAPPLAPPLAGAVAATPGLDGTSTYVHVSLAGAPPGAAYPWRLREGPCGGGGAVVGPAAAYGPLAVNAEGRAAAAATVPRHLSPGARYHVRVGASPADPETVVACGELTPPTR